MKKITSLLLSILLIISLVGCGLSEDNPPLSEPSQVEEASKSATTNSTQSDKIFSFSSEDIEGNTVTDEILKDSKLILVNIWEPWCGPCVGEMPDLEKLYETYKEQGLLIIGMFSSTDMDDEARQIINDCNITYPIVRGNSDTEKYMTNYFPTSFFTDSEGVILSKKPLVGARSYSDWESLIKSYLLSDLK